MKNSSFWLDIPYNPRPPLAQDLETEVVIIGGGIMGVSAAYHSIKAGFKTVLIEKSHIASESAGKNGGMVVEGLAIDFCGSVEKFGKEEAREAWQGTVSAKKYVISLIKDNNIECDFSQPGSLYVASKEDEEEILQNEIEERRKAGFSCKLISEFNPAKKALLVLDDCSLHPVKFVRSLAEIAEKNGLIIYEQTEALLYDGNTVRTPHGIIKAKKVIVAIETSKSDISSSQGVVHREMALVTEPMTPQNISRMNWQQGGMFWNTGDEYIAARKIGNRLFLNISVSIDPSQEDLDVAQEKVIERFLHFVPGILKEEIAFSHRWTGLLLYPKRSKPYITHNKGYHELFGSGGNGLTKGIMLGKLIIDFFTGKKIPKIYQDSDQNNLKKL